jgi:AcrR family transcriptional regulator
MTSASGTEERAGRDTGSPRGRATVDRILDAALAEFSAYGLRRTAMEDVARRAGVARATVYRKFAVKDALVQAVIMREGGRFMAEFDTVVRRYATLDEQVVEGWAFAIAYMREHPLFNGLLAADPEAILPYLTIGNRELLDACREFFAPFVAAAQDRGEIPGYDPGPVAELMVRIVLSYVISPAGYLDLGDEAATREFARRHLVPALRAGV